VAAHGAAASEPAPAGGAHRMSAAAGSGGRGVEKREAAGSFQKLPAEDLHRESRRRCPSPCGFAAEGRERVAAKWLQYGPSPTFVVGFRPTEPWTL